MARSGCKLRAPVSGGVIEGRRRSGERRTRVREDLIDDDRGCARKHVGGGESAAGEDGDAEYLDIERQPDDREVTRHCRPTSRIGRTLRSWPQLSGDAAVA
jgi:hypothetical protein